MKFYLWPHRSAFILIAIVLYSSSIIHAQDATSGKRLINVVSERWVNETWTNQNESEYQYNGEGEQSRIIHSRWTEDTWGDSVIVTNSYNPDGLLSEREEYQIVTNRILTHEVYSYNDENKLMSISFPDVPWFRARGIFNVLVGDFTTTIDPYLLTNWIQEIRYDYNQRETLNRIDYVSRGDLIQDTLFVGEKIHPIESQSVITGTDITPLLDAYQEDLWDLEPVGDNQVNRNIAYTYQSNGQQISALSAQNPETPDIEVDKAWDFYDLWHPVESRTIWFYSEKPASVSPYHFMATHTQPRQSHRFFSDRLSFWLITNPVSTSISNISLYSVIAPETIQTRYYTSKLAESRSFTAAHIPGNYFQFFYEPRYRGTIPVRDKQIIKSVEQYMLPIRKDNSGIYYQISWNDNFQWLNSLERSFEYDDQGRLVASTVKIWDWDKSNLNPTAGWWANDSRYEFSYDASGNGSQIHRYIWNTETDSWQNIERITYTYEDIPAGKIHSAVSDAVLLTNHPNPFTGSTEIIFQTESPATVSLYIYDITGSLIKTILETAPLAADNHAYLWDGTDQSGRNVPSGIYLYRLEVNGSYTTGRCLVVK